MLFAYSLLFVFFLSFFFFYCSGDHLDLHSFPTRRSSDLLSIVIHLAILSRRSKMESETQRSWFYLLAAYRRLRRRWHERSEEHTSELQSHSDLVCRLLLEKKKKKKKTNKYKIKNKQKRKI